MYRKRFARHLVWILWPLLEAPETNEMRRSERRIALHGLICVCINGHQTSLLPAAVHTCSNRYCSVIIIKHHRRYTTNSAPYTPHRTFPVHVHQMHPPYCLQSPREYLLYRHSASITAGWSDLGLSRIDIRTSCFSACETNQLAAVLDRHIVLF